MVFLGARAHDFAGNTPETLFPAIREAGYETVQLACAKSFGWAYPLDDGQTERILMQMEKYHISVHVLGCYVECAAQDKAERLQAVDTYINALKTGSKLHVKCVGTETCRVAPDAASHKAAFDRLTDSVLRMAEAAEKYDVDMGLEPVFEHSLNTPEAALELKHRVGSQHLKFIWDAVNMLDPEAKRDEGAYQRYFAGMLGDDIVAMHIKGVKYKGLGRKIACPLTEGEMDWTYPFAFARQKDGMALLREEAIPARAAEEIAFMRELLK